MRSNQFKYPLNRRNFLYFAAALAVTASTKAIGAPNANKIVLGQIGLSFYAVAGAVIRSVLERLGHTVEIREGTHADIFPLLGAGEVDLLVAAWLPNAHGPFWQQYQSQAIQLGTLYENARLFWAVPSYVPETAVSSVEDLLKPEVAARMNKTIYGINPSSGLMRRSAQIMERYDLERAGYNLRPGAASDWMANFEAAVRDREWVIIPLWQPQFLNRAYQVRPLQEPIGLFGGSDRAVLVAYRDFENKFDDRTVNTLKRIDLGLDAVTEMDYMVNVGNMTPTLAARNWMQQNTDKVNSWIA